MLLHSCIHVAAVGVKGQKMYDAFLGVRESLASAAEPAVRYVLHLMSSQL